MLVYLDLISNDPILSDAYPWVELRYQGQTLAGIMAVQSQLVLKTGSAEPDMKVNNIIDTDLGFGYEGPSALSNVEFISLYKNWCNRVKQKLEDSGKNSRPFMASAKAFMDFTRKEYSRFEIYSPKSFNVETFIVGWWDEDDHALGCPKFLYFKDALQEKKV
ncbi:MAG: hypothetical protein E6Q83_09385 [Thiothrix sp.]|nr:MAG: hypothetical protein E6Q83_09385 [Thiothrix sp.]